MDNQVKKQQAGRQLSHAGSHRSVYCSLPFTWFSTTNNIQANQGGVMSNKSKYIRTAGAAALGMLVLADSNAMAMGCVACSTSGSGITSTCGLVALTTVVSSGWNSSSGSATNAPTTNPSAPILATSFFIDNMASVFTPISDALAAGYTITITKKPKQPAQITAFDGLCKAPNGGSIKARITSEIGRGRQGKELMEKATVHLTVYTGQNYSGKVLLDQDFAVTLIGCTFGLTGTNVLTLLKNRIHNSKDIQVCGS